MAGSGYPIVGNLNLGFASVIWPSFPQLNVTAQNLTKAGIRLAPEGAATGRIPVMVGVVNSQQPYQTINVTINLLKTQIISALYQAQFQLNTLLGNCTITPDIPVGAAGLSPYQLANCSLMNYNELDFSGSSPDYPVHVSATYYLNSSMFA